MNLSSSLDVGWQRMSTGRGIRKVYPRTVGCRIFNKDSNLGGEESSKKVKEDKASKDYIIWILVNFNNILNRIDL
jgi:hypothetical protein